MKVLTATATTNFFAALSRPKCLGTVVSKKIDMRGLRFQDVCGNAFDLMVIVLRLVVSACSGNCPGQVNLRPGFKKAASAPARLFVLA